MREDTEGGWKMGPRLREDNGERAHSVFAGGGMGSALKEERGGAGDGGDEMGSVFACAR